ncbi:DNA polymerase III subunit delta' [Acinetobacter soli]|uniref:DNA polymerase III subunit delta' n=1 Tax=Acinetobacter soli TaxID=487316 RepID=UPI001D0ADBAC|nr:DNA polymerase III subunit delta' [Acinetobacter soli]MCB8767550.1 DNA polymerase III subunit delta' [Acinetobacter soli]
MKQHQAKVYPWQATVWKSLTGRFPQLGHGLLFYGKSGSGKHAFALHFLSWVLCTQKKPEGACGECISCQWLKSDTHPNYVYITTDDDNKKQNAKIKIEKIRDLLPFVQQTVDGWRVIVIKPAEALNIASANALLKTLEEPGEKVLIILIADHYLKLPATIRSRLQHFSLDRMTFDQAQDYLSEQLPTLDPADIQLLLNLSNDMPLKAVELAEADWFNKRRDFVSDWIKLVKQKNMPLMIASKWQKELAAADWLIMFEYLLGDLICVKLNQDPKNIDLDFEELSSEYALEQLFDLYAQIQHSKQLIGQNVQTNLVIDQLFIQLMNVNGS